MFKHLLSPLFSQEQSLDRSALTEDSSVIGGKIRALDDIQKEAAELLSGAFFSGDQKSVGPIGCHLSTNTLEEYALGLLVQAERDSVDDHVLVCEFCRGNLEKADGVIAFLKNVLIPATAEISTAVCPWFEEEHLPPEFLFSVGNRLS